MNASLSGNAWFSVPGGYPFRFWAGTDTLATGFIPKWVTSISATLQTELGTCNAHLALYTPPTTSGGNDGALVFYPAATANAAALPAQTDLIGLSTTAQTITLAIPSGTTIQPQTYVVRLWVDGIVGIVAGKDRGTGTADTLLPGVKLTSFTVA